MNIFKVILTIIVIMNSLNAYERTIQCWELDSGNFAFNIGIANKKYLVFHSKSIFSDTIATFYRTDISKKTDNKFDIYKIDDKYAFIFQRDVNEGQYNTLKIVKRDEGEYKFLCKESK